ncbi:MAG: GNAT family N-acetyltransferase [Chloroflexota bacterium]
MTRARGAATATAAATRSGITFRKATTADLPACTAIWRDALNDYMGRLNLPEIPPENASIGRLHAHLLATDPDGFVVAERDGRPIGFTSSVRRGDLWFLSMLFVRPGEQGAGLGRALLAELLPADGAALATATDSAQPISNALYATYGIVPRVPLLNFVGRPMPGARVPSLPAGVTATRLDPSTAATAAELDAVDADVVGFVRPADHGFLVGEGRVAFAYRSRAGETLGYGYTSEAGRVGPVAVRDESLLPAVLGHILTAVVPRGASALWVAGSAGRAVVALLELGLRLDGFPVLLCWDRPIVDFERYLPISPGLL